MKPESRLPSLRALTSEDKKPLPDEFPETEPYIIAGIPSDTLGYLMQELPINEADNPIAEEEFEERKQIAQWICWNHRLQEEEQHGPNYFEENPDGIGVLEGLAVEIIFAVESEERERVRELYNRANNQ